MSIVKSFSVGDGDMFYIRHNSSNFTMIDCYLSELEEADKVAVISEVLAQSKGKEIRRFISTHPDDDHIGGLKLLDEKHPVYNFYCVKNEATKTEPTEDFTRYCELRDSEKVFHLRKGCTRKWMNDDDGTHGASGIEVHWPITDHEHHVDALAKAKEGKSPNNISAVVTYKVTGGVTMMWMGDLEGDHMAKIEEDLHLPEADILFAPHHGRASGKVPESVLKKINPKVVVIGEAPSEHLNYYKGYNTITQNSAGDITFDCVTGKVHIYVSNSAYSVNFLSNESQSQYSHYLGTLTV